MSKKNYHVTHIIDEYSIIINYGRLQGAKLNDTVQIVTPGCDVIDPIDNKLLGTLDMIKASLSVVTIYDNFSVCKDVNVDRQSIFTALLPLLSEDVTKYKPIDIDPSAPRTINYPEDRYVKIGDLAEVI